MKVLLIYLRYWVIRLFFLIFLLLIISGSYFFNRIPDLSLGSFRLINPFYKNVVNFPPWLYAVEYFIFIFVLAIFLIIVLIFYYSVTKNRRVKARKRHSDEIVDSLFECIYVEQEYTDEEKRIKVRLFESNLKTDYSKRLFIDALRKIHSQTVGVVRERTSNLLKAIHYDYFIKAYLYSPYLRNKIFALKVISEFQLEGYEKYIMKLTKRSNNVLHSEALVSLVKLNINYNLLFLVDLDIKLSLWDVNVMVKILEQYDKHTTYYYYVLIQSDNPEISALGIILTRLHNRQDLKMDVKDKIGNVNFLVNEEAFLTFSLFAENQNDYDFLMDNFELASEKAQNCIIKVIASCPDKNVAIRFLERVVEHNPLTHKLEAIRLLLEIDLNIVKRYKDSDNVLIRQACLQILDLNL